MREFDEVWQDIIVILKDDNTVLTLPQKKPNIVMEINEDGLMVAANSEPKLVKKLWIEEAWRILSSKRTMIADDIPGTARYRSSFIMALLAKLPYVKSTTDPNKLYLFPSPKGKRPEHASCLNQCIPAELVDVFD